MYKIIETESGSKYFVVAQAEGSYVAKLGGTSEQRGVCYGKIEVENNMTVITKPNKVTGERGFFITTPIRLIQSFLCS